MRGHSRDSLLRGALSALSGLLGVSLATAAGAVQGPAAPALASAATPLVFRGVTVIDVKTGQKLSGRTVTIVGTRIERIETGGKARPPRGAQVVDAKGKYLIPGLWDMHIHPKTYADGTFPLFLANGVTGVRDAGSDVPLATFRLWKQQIAAGTRIGPRLIVAGPSVIQANSDHNWASVTAGAGQASHILYVPPSLARRVVDSLHAAGADMLKLYLMSPEMRLAMADEARRVGVPFGGHSADMSGLKFADSGAAILDHQTWIWECGGGDGAQAGVQNFDAAKCAAAVQRLRRTNTWVVENYPIISPSTFGRIGRYQPHSLLTKLLDTTAQQQVRRYAAAADSLMALEPTSTAAWAQFVQRDAPNRWTEVMVAKAQTDSLRRRHAIRPILAGTDMALDVQPFGLGLIPGFSLHPVLVRYVLTGLTPLEALQAATLNPAQALRAADSLGTVAPGKVADLVLLDADPLADIWHTTKIRAVVANGRYYDRAALDGLLRAAEQAARSRGRDTLWQFHAEP